MTAVTDDEAAAARPAAARRAGAPDRRGSWIPTWGMIASRNMELRKRRGLMIALISVTIGFPAVFLLIRLLLHAFAPKSYGPAGGFSVFQGLVAGALFLFGFIVAATLGCTAGSVDLTEGMFRHLVVTGRSRLALYFARIPAGLGIIVPLVAVGFALVCFVCVYAAPTNFNFDGVKVPPGLSQKGLENWAADHPQEVVCGFGFNFTGNGPQPPNVNCPGPGGGQVVIQGKGPGAPGGVGNPPAAQLRAFAIQIAKQDYYAYSHTYLAPPVGLMVDTGLWIELEAIIGFVVGLGLGSLLGQRTVAVVLMIVLEIVLTPLAARVRIPHMWNLQRAIVGLAVDHLEPAGLGFLFGGGDNGGQGSPTALLLPETTKEAVFVIVAWLVGWTAIGAWRMARRDA
jgi:hypothetical protein